MMRIARGVVCKGIGWGELGKQAFRWMAGGFALGAVLLQCGCGAMDDPTSAARPDPSRAGGIQASPQAPSVNLGEIMTQIGTVTAEVSAMAATGALSKEQVASLDVLGRVAMQSLSASPPDLEHAGRALEPILDIVLAVSAGNSQSRPALAGTIHTLNVLIAFLRDGTGSTVFQTPTL